MEDSVLEEVVRVTLQDMTEESLRTLTRNLDAAQRALRTFTGERWQLRLNLLDQLTAPLRGVMSAARGMIGGALEVPVRMVGGIGGLFTGQNLQNLAYAQYLVQGLAGTVTGLGNAIGVGLNAQLENATAQITAMTGSTAQAADIVALLRKEADATPFTFQEMVGSVASLIPVAKATGMQLQDLIKMAEVLAASHPEQGLVGAAFALRDTASGGVQSMSDRFDLSRKTIEKWRDSSGNAMVGVQHAMEEMGYSGELVDRMSQTLTGRWSTMTDALGSFTRTASLGIFERLKSGLETMFNWMDANKEAIDGLSQAINVGLGNAADLLGRSFAAIWTTTGRFVDLVKGAFTAWTMDAGAMGVVYDQLRAIFGDTLGNAFQPMLQWMMDSIPYWNRTLQFLWSAVSGGTSFSFVFGSQVGPVLDRMRVVLVGVVDAFGRFFAWVGPIATAALAGNLRGALNMAGEAVHGLAINLLYSTGLMEPLQRLWQRVTDTADRFSFILIPLRNTVVEIWDAFGRFFAWLAPIANALFAGQIPQAVAMAQSAFTGLGLNLVATLQPAIDKLQELRDVVVGQALAAFQQLQSFMEPWAPTWNRIVGVVSVLVGWFNQAENRATAMRAGMVGLTGVTAPLYAAFLMLATFTNTLTGALAGAWHWLEQHKEVQTTLAFLVGAVAGVLGVMTAAMVVNTIATAASLVPLALWVAQLYAASVAQAALNLVMDANPIALVVVAIAGLTAALVFLYNTNDTARQLMDEAWSAIGQAATFLWQNAILPAFTEIQRIIDDFSRMGPAALLLLPSRFVELGLEIMNGLIQGFTGVDVLGWIRTNITDNIPQFIKDALGIHSPSTVFAGIGANIMQGLINGISARVPDVMGLVNSVAGRLSGMGGDVFDWISSAISIAGVPASWAQGLALIIQHESGGNPLARNDWDINAQMGDPSVGLGQLTGSNRTRYTPAGMDQMNPIAQVVAMIRYIMDRYGDIARVPGVASVASGGPYLPYDSGGWLPQGRSLVVNQTGRPEPVLSPSQWASMSGGRNVTVTGNNVQFVLPAGSGPDHIEYIKDHIDEMWSALAGHIQPVIANTV